MLTNRLRMQLSKEEGLKELDKVVLNNGYVSGHPYSFKDHEYQIEILRDTRSRISVQKCSQVGLSELMVQKILAMCATMNHTRIIFTLPTREMAMAFSKDRFDGAIEQSPMYSAMMEKASNSATQKKVGSCTLYIAGSFGANSAISVPAECVISDEEDFSNEVILGKLNSRLRHASLCDERGNRGIRMRFSTPTVDGYGVNNGFMAGDQKYYFCKCEHCEKWTLPSFFDSFVIKGLDRSTRELSKDDLRDRRLLVDETYIQCNHCKKDLQKSLLDPARRQWVAKYPEVWEHSYQVSPWDVPVYNPPNTVLKQLGDYPLKSDFYNFVVGIPYSDSENTFETSSAFREQQSKVALVPYKEGAPRLPFETFAGLDVGKTCHLTIFRRSGKNIELIWAEKINNTKDNPALDQIIKRYNYFNVKKMCIDAGPDITLVNSLVSAKEGISAVVYVRSTSSLTAIDVKQGGDVINADRTKTLSLFLSKHNSGEIMYPDNYDITFDVFEHLKTTKKIRERSSDGNMVERFCKSSDTDHWVHSINYAMIANASCEVDTSFIVPVGALIGTAKLNSFRSYEENKLFYW